jgi:hypothetical protein
MRLIVAKLAFNRHCVNMTIGIDDYVTTDEIKHALRHAKNSAPGPDGIRYDDIGKMHDEGLEELATIYNTNITNAAAN